MARARTFKIKPWSTPSVFARYVPGASSKSGANWFVLSAGTTCPARIITEAAFRRRSRIKFANEISLGGRPVALKITDRMVDGVALDVLEGRIVVGEESNALREKIKS